MAASAQSPPGFESGSLGNVIRPVGKTTAPHPHASTPHSTTATTTRPTPAPSWLNSAALTPKQMDDQATSEANASIAPQVTGLQQQQQNYDAQQKAYEAAMTGFYAALAPYMAGIQGHVSDAYNSAGATMGGVAQGYAGTLGASAQANADATKAALERGGQTQAIDSATAQANPGSALTDAFSATHGGIAGASFAEEGAAKAADAAQKPAIWAAQGRDSMTEAINKAVAGDQKYADQIKNIYATVPGLRDTILKQIQSAELDKAKYAADQKNTAFDQAYKTHQAKLDDAKFAAAQSNTAFNQKASVARYNLEVTKAQWQQSNADRTYGLNYSKYMAAETKAANAQKHGGLSATAWNNLQGKVQDYTKGLYQGVPGHVTYPSSSNGLSAPRIDSWKQKPMTYQQAIKTLIQRYPALGASGAIRAANSLYQPGEGGRPAFTPQQQAINDSLIPNNYNGLQGGGTGAAPFGGSPVVSAAKGFLGVPYKWGGTNPKTGLDCSAFIQQAFAKVGISLPRTTYGQVKYGQDVPLDQLQPGDAVFTEPGKNGPNHVGLYIGNGMVQQSPHTGTVNGTISLQSFLGGGFVAARRYK